MPPPKKGPEPVVPPQLPKIVLLVKVVDGFNKPLPAAEVEVVGKAIKNTDANGLANFGLVNPRTTFDIKARKSKFGPPGNPFTPGEHQQFKKADPNGPIVIPLTLNVAQLIVTVETLAKKKLEGASVGIDGVTGTPMPTTDAKGTIGPRLVPAGVAIRFHAEKQDFGPDPKGGAFKVDTLVEGSVTLVDGQTKLETLVLTSAEFHMHVDANRDGKVDDDRTGIDKWEFGAAKKGAIVICNNDDDAAASVADNKDDAVNGGNDKDELAPLVIRRVGTIEGPATWEAFLEVSAADAKHIRIFETRTTGAKEVIGPVKGTSFKFPDLKFAEKELGIEAVQFADDTFNGLVTITFKITKAGAELVKEKAVFRVAPWMMANHLDAAEKLFVVNFRFNRPAGGPTDNGTFRGGMGAFATAAGCTVTTHTVQDQWMQDCMEFGFTNLPTVGLRSVLRAQRPRLLQAFPKSLLAADLGYHEHGKPASMIPATNPVTGAGNPGSEESTFNSHGNLEVTPPTKSKAGKNYPFGRIYFGGVARPPETFDAKVRSFLEKQIVQEPFRIDTSWLMVGHVDEFISFVPGGGKGFTLLLASPKRGYAILDANRAAHGSDKMLVGRHFPELDANGRPRAWHAAEVSIQAFLTTGIPALKFGGRTAGLVTGAALRTFNAGVQASIDRERAKLETEIGVTSADIIEVPILYVPNDVAVRSADALTGGMVNMLVANKKCLVPMAFGPIVGGKDLFQDDLETKLTPLGVTLQFIDDWFEYHVNLGEVHCGTNTLRSPKVAKWWEFTP